MNAEVAQSLAGIQDVTGRLLATVGGLTDAPPREPSLLPGRSRGHVLTHITRNAAELAAEPRDSSGRAAQAAARPDDSWMVQVSRAGRAGLRVSGDGGRAPVLPPWRWRQATARCDRALSGAGPGRERMSIAAQRPTSRAKESQ